MKSKLLITIFLSVIYLHVLRAQSIASFTPVSGAPGTSVIITGTGFNTTTTNNIVYFGATRATVTAATATSLTVTIPSGATHATISVLNTSNSLAAFTTTEFIPTYTGGKGTAFAASDFNTQTTHNLGTNYQSSGVVLCDVDGDGKPDMVASNPYTNQLSVLLNNGSGGNVSFATKTSYNVAASGTSPMCSPAFADLDGDGKQDIVVGDNGSGTVSIFKNSSSSGSVSLGTRQTVSTLGTPYAIAFADFNTDGKPDMIVAHNGSTNASVFPNTSTSGSISFGTRIDLAIGGAAYHGIGVADYDGDGKVDFAILNRGGSAVSVVRNTSTTSIAFAGKVDFTLAASNGYWLSSADIDGDGKNDLAVCYETGTIASVFRNTSTTGNITMNTRQDLTCLSNSRNVCFADINGDSKVDMLIPAFSGTAAMYLNTGSSGTISFAATSTVNIGAYPEGGTMGDVNSDGKPDIVQPNFGGFAIYVTRNDAAAANADLSSLTVSSGTLSPTFASATTIYTATVATAVNSITVTPTRSDPGSTIDVRVNGGSYSAVTSGNASGSLALNVGSNTIDVKVTGPGGAAIKVYSITVTRSAPPQLAGGTTYPVNGTSSALVSFATIQEAATFLATNGITGTGNVLLELQAGYSAAAEPATGIYFDTIIGATSSRGVILRPGTGFSATVSGTVAAAGMLNLRGTQFLTIDGRQGGAGLASLILHNLSTATTDLTSTVKFSGGVSNVVLSYCNVKGASKSVTNGGVILFSTGSATSGNNQINIENCNIDGTGAAHNGICSNGSITNTTVENMADTIRNCNIFDYFDNGGSSGTAAIRTQQGTASMVITGNSMYQTVPRVYTAQFLTFGIIVGAGTYFSSDNITITNNYIGGSGPMATGVMSLSAGSVVAGYSAVFMNYGNSAVVSGNTIKNINVTGNSSAGTFTNPAVFSSLFYGGSVSITNNTIDSFRVTNTAGPVTMSAIHIATQLDTTFIKNITPFYTIQNNTIRNITATPSSTGNGQSYGIRLAPVSTTGQGGNLYFNNTTVLINQNTIDGIRSLGVSTSSYSHGIWASAANGGTSTHFVRLFPTITSNTIKNISCSGAITATGYPVAAGIVILNAHTSNAAYTDTIKIRSNTIQDIYGFNTGDLNTSVGAVFTNLGRADISRNKIFNIYNSANGSTNSPYVYGVNIFGLANTSSVDNNFISLGDTATQNQAAYGVIQSASAASALSTNYNTILISGGASNKNSAGIMRGDPLSFAGNTTAVTLRNNLLINRRTGSGNNVAIAMPGTNLFTSNNNTLITATAAKAAFYNAAAVDLATWKSNTAADVYSYYAQSAGASALSADPATV
ncbi:MAG: FG-GAP-like repeat-containing protein, partial [Bacteroidota bacterium]